MTEATRPKILLVSVLLSLAAGASGAVPSGPDTWPHTIPGEAGTATVYQPQAIAWPDRQTLNARAVIGITPKGVRAPLLGVIEVAFATQTDLSDRTVLLTSPKLVSARFPTSDAAQAAQFEERIKAALDKLPPKRVPLATLVMSLLRQAEKPPDVALDNTPPQIFVSQRPASLVVFDGGPVLAPIPDTTLSFAVNTNWDVFTDTASKRWYLLNNGAWFIAFEATGPWELAAKLPPSFAALPDDANFAAVKKQVPGRTLAAKDAPTVFVSKAPAEIIVTNGPPRYQPIPGTSLHYVSNTDAAVFNDTAGGRVYLLVSGRWFSAPAFSGPWTFATPNLPADFARIPANGPRGFVRVSVPGTPEAEEALIEAQIPQQATLRRDAAKLDVVYAGAPQFAAIPGTPMQYAVNTSFSVIQAGDGYYACYQGAWFAAAAPAGPWALTTTVPAVIYGIPPSNPMYPCTYVRVYASTPDSVTYGYTAGYSLGYVSAGVIVYGTGYYYPPYIYPAPIPIYYPYPYSYAGATYYNAATGAWAHGGAIYGPNGGAGAFSAYNPSTGSYAHGSAAWGPGGASGNANWYNANTGRSGSTQQNSNAYGRWGSSTISGPNQTVHTQSQSDARGSAGAFTSTSGAKGAPVSGAGGNNAAVVKGPGGDVYAGADGNVYKKTSDGWSKYDNGSWNAAQKPSGSQSNAAATQRTTAPRTAASAGAENTRQLDQDRQARTQGAQRQQQFNASRTSAQGSRNAAGRSGSALR